MRVAWPLTLAAGLGLAAWLWSDAVSESGGVRAARADGTLDSAFLATLAAAVALAGVVIRPEQGTTAALRRFSAAISLVLLIAIVGLWHLTYRTERDQPRVGVRLVDRTEIDQATALYRVDTAARQLPVYLIPTGVFVQSIEFLDTNDLLLTGYIWQTYADDVPEEIARGFTLPEANSVAGQAREEYRYAVPGGTVIGWYIQATLRQQFDYARYPFDRQDVRLRILHPDLQGRAVLVPDVAAYPTLDPRSLPGLEPGLVYEGWSPEFTAFSLAVVAAGVTYGLPDQSPLTNYPELYFSVGLSRDLLDPLISNAFPQAMILTLVFAALLVLSRDKQKQSHFGSEAFDVLRYSATLMFVAVLAHNRLRSSVTTGQAGYLEVLPYLSYVAILLVTAVALALALPPRFAVIEYRDNELSRVLFWPLALGSLLVVTWIVL